MPERESHALGGRYLGYLAHENSKGKARIRSRHENNSKRVVKHLEERNVDTKKKSPKQGLASAKNLTMELPEGRESTTID